MKFATLTIGALLLAVGMAAGYYLGGTKDFDQVAITPSPHQASEVKTFPERSGVSAGAVRSALSTDVHAGLTMPALPRVEKFQIGSGNVKSLLADGPVLWVGSSFGVIRYDIAADQHKIFNNQNSPILSNGVFYLTEIDDKLWVGTYGGGLHSYDGSGWQSYNIPHGLGDAFIYGMAEVPSGDVWIGTWSGANRVRGGRIGDPRSWDLYTVENTSGGLPNDWVYAVDYDSKGNIWFGTEGGVARFDGRSWENWTHEDGLGAPYEKVKHALIQSPDTASGQSQHHARQKVEMGLTEVDVPFNPNYIVSMMVDEKDRVWLGTWGGGLSILDNGQFQTYTSDDGLRGNYISMITQGPDGTVWVGSNQALSKVSEGDGDIRFTSYGVNDGLFDRITFSMAFGDDRSIWVGSYGGVSHFPDGLPERPTVAPMRRLLPTGAG